MRFTPTEGITSWDWSHFNRVNLLFPKSDVGRFNVGVLEMAEEVAGQHCCLVYEVCLLQLASLKVRIVVTLLSEEVTVSHLYDFTCVYCACEQI